MAMASSGSVEAQQHSKLHCMWKISSSLSSKLVLARIIGFQTFSSRAKTIEDLVKEWCRSAANLEIKYALQLFDEMLAANPKPSIYCFNITLTRIIRMKNPSHYHTILSLYGNMNRVDGISFDTVTYGVLIDCCTRMNRVDLGFAIFGTMLKHGECIADIVIFNTLVKGLCVEKRVVDAAQPIVRMPQCGCAPDVFTFSTLIKGFCSIGSTTMALEFLQKMKNAKGVDCKPNVVTYSTIIDALCKKGAMDKVSEMLQEMMDSGVQPNVVTFNTLMHSLCKQRATAEAQKLFNLMVESDEKPNAITYNVLLHGYSLEGQFDKVADLLNSMRHEGLTIDIQTYSSVIDTVRTEGWMRLWIFSSKCKEKG